MNQIFINGLVANATSSESFWQSTSQALQSGAGVGGAWALALGLVLVCFASWLLNLIALPGNWMAIAVLGLFGWLGPDTGRVSIGLEIILAAFALGLIGEAIEFAASALGASRAGASRRATLMAIVGSVVGAITGGLIGIPIPIIGPILAAILFGGLGATAGAIYAEYSNGRSWRESWRIGKAAFWGRTAGTVGKMVAGLGIVMLSIFGVVL